MEHSTRPFRIVALAAAVAGCAGSRAPATPASASPIGQMGDAAAIERARIDSIRHPYTEGDIRFMSQMISHHAQAVAMSRLAPTHGASTAIRTLAGRIINAQNDEIALMQTWLRDRRQPVPEADPAGMKMTMAGHTHTMLMPGMLSEEEMKRLDAARGQEFDTLFLTFMIKHHRGAVAMVDELFASRGSALNETVFKFAADVHVDQTTEIARMTQMLLGLPGGNF